MFPMHCELIVLLKGGKNYVESSLVCTSLQRLLKVKLNGVKMLVIDIIQLSNLLEEKKCGNEHILLGTLV